MRPETWFKVMIRFVRLIFFLQRSRMSDGNL